MTPGPRSFQELLTADRGTLDPLPRGRGREQSSRSRAYRRLREAVILCEIPPGHAVSEKEIAEALGVSRTPVREALQRLADDGLVVIRPQQGTEASRISPRRVREAQLVRELLERSAFAITAQCARVTDLEGLEDHLAVQARAARRGAFAAFFQADQRFHHDLAVLSGFEGLGRIAGTARAHLDRVRGLSLPEPEAMQHLVDEHRAVVEHLREGDHAGGDEILRAHLRSVLAVLPTMQARFADYFSDDEGPAVELRALAIACDVLGRAGAPAGPGALLQALEQAGPRGGLLSG